MKINLEQLYLLQCEVLRPFSPTQEFALLNLVVDNVSEAELEEFGADVVQAFPHMQRLYSGFINASQNIPNIMPFAVPVMDSESALQDVLADTETGLNLSPALIGILTRACSRVPVAEPHVDELNFPVEHAPALTPEIIAQLALSAIRYGLAPIVVRPTREQRNNRANWSLNCSKLFGTKFVEENPLSPTQRLEYRVCGRSTLEIARLQSVN
ncbi:hypothetical protein pEaSNUABM5_00314 [Erwinia phage pEa_SNUABM_5]|uniref:Uncharacterized protein n=1 Tax=Erwinia phage pEa_SNUABM_5 TaxID=2797313 RepID=A0A7T8EPT2_9CAUD|nr:hypothetical protein MPK73_gp314 [Erwinia phage pEa_SNUABM_5]QQO90456.1 hypothetical protein pEaSNUABM5_00314 [Erwinia phage pEa_SNUABM_5]